MSEFLLNLPDAPERTLRQRIKEAMVEKVLSGNHPENIPLPSCRTLARQLGVAKNTVVDAYKDLVADGLIEARERRGYFLIPQLQEPVSAMNAGRVNFKPTFDWNDRIRSEGAVSPNIYRPDDWDSSPYPFVYGQVDLSLFPLAHWRECSRMALNRQLLSEWTGDRYGGDSVDLVRQIRTRLLPRRGINADAAQILITLGSQNAIYLVARLLCDRSTVVGFEEPGYPDAWNAFNIASGGMLPLMVDHQGLVISDELSDCDLVFTTPSHHYPTTVTMSLERRHALLESAERHDFLIIEDDYEFENNYVGQPSPALKAMDKTGRVIYVGSLSKTMYPGLRLGYIVADQEFIAEARTLRSAMLRHPPSSTQQTAALFVGLGHHDALIRKLHREYKARWLAMGDALDKYLPAMSTPPAFGGTSFWVRGPDWLDAHQLAEQARDKGVILEPASACFHSKHRPKNYFRLGFSSIALDKIHPGVARIAQAIEELK